MMPLQQFVDFGRYVPESMEEKEHVINRVSNVNNRGDEIHHLVKDFKNCIILVLLYPLSIKRKARWKLCSQKMKRILLILFSFLS